MVSVVIMFVLQFLRYILTLELQNINRHYFKN